MCKFFLGKTYFHIYIQSQGRLSFVVLVGAPPLNQVPSGHSTVQSPTPSVLYPGLHGTASIVNSIQFNCHRGCAIFHLDSMNIGTQSFWAFS